MKFKLKCLRHSTAERRDRVWLANMLRDLDFTAQEFIIVDYCLSTFESKTRAKLVDQVDGEVSQFYVLYRTCHFLPFETSFQGFRISIKHFLSLNSRALSFLGK